MDQQLRELAALVEDQNFVPSLCVGLFTATYNSCCKEYNILFWPLWVPTPT